MRTTQEQFQAAVEEFGEEAYKMFKAREVEGKHFIDARNNLDVETWIVFPETFVCELKSNQDLIAHDIEAYGEQAYLMWEYSDDKGGSPVKSNQALLRIIHLGWIDKITRKTSAALPFDLERALAGDTIEFSFRDAGSNNIVWETVKFLRQDHTGIYFYHPSLGKWFTKDTCKLRMKYPPKANKGV